MPKRAIIPRTPPTDAPTMAPVDRELSLDVGKDSGNVVAGVVALGTPNELVEDKPSIGGKILNAGERWTLLELESSVILNWYCWVVGMSDGITSVAMPVFWSVEVNVTMLPAPDAGTSWMVTVRGDGFVHSMVVG